MDRRPYEAPQITTLAAEEVVDALGPAQGLSSGACGGGGGNAGGPSSAVGGGSGRHLGGR